MVKPGRSSRDPCVSTERTENGRQEFGPKYLRPLLVLAYSLVETASLQHAHVHGPCRLCFTWAKGNGRIFTPLQRGTCDCCVLEPGLEVHKRPGREATFTEAV